MLTTFLTTLALAVSTAIASPAPGRRQSTAPGCGGAFNGVGNVANFTLKAYFNNKTTVPLGLVPMTPSLLLSFIVVSNDQVPLTMVNSGVRVLGGGAVSEPVSSGGSLEFISFTSQDPAEVYCLLFSTSPNGSPFPGPLLAVNGDADHFSICPGGQNNQQAVVEYKTTSRKCVPAHIIIVEA